MSGTGGFDYGPLIERELARRRARAAPVAEPPSQLSTESVTASVERIQAARVGSLQLSFDAGARLGPEKASRASALARQFRLAPDVVARNLDRVERIVASRQNDPQRLWRERPRTAAWLANPHNAGAALDDVATLEGLERIRGGAGASIGLGVEQNRLSLYSAARDLLPGFAEKWFTGLRGQDLDAEIRRLEERVGRYLGAETEIEEATQAFLQQLPLMVDALTFGGAAAAGAGTATVSTGAGAPAAVITVPSAAAIGSGAYVGLVEAGAAMRELAKPVDGREPLPHGARVVAGIAIGAINGALEVQNFQQLGRLAPLTRDLKRMILGGTKRALVRALSRPTLRTATTRFAKDVGAAAASEGATEFAQGMTASILGHVSRSFQDGQWTRYNAAEEIARSAEEGLIAFEATLVGGPLFGAVPFAGDVATVRRVARVQRQVQAYTAASEGSKLRQRSPEIYADAVRKIAIEGSGSTHAFIDVNRWDAWAAKRGVTGAEAAREVLGDDVLYQEARSLEDGGDLVIPIERFMARVVGTEAHAELAQDVRLFQSDPSPRQLHAWREKFGADFQREVAAEVEPEQLEPGVRSIRDDVYRQAIAAGETEKRASANAQVAAAFFTALAAHYERAGQPRSPLALYEAQKLTIERRESARASRPELVLLQSDDSRWTATPAPPAGKAAKGQPIEVLDLPDLEAPDLGKAPAAVYRTGARFVAATPAGEAIAPERSTIGEAKLDAERWADSPLRQDDDSRIHGSFRSERATGRRVIQLFESADPSTLLHELSHFFFDVLRTEATAEDAPETLRAAYRDALEALGVKGAKPTREQLEKWARWFEAYLLEGKTPSVELSTVFARFRVWLLEVYHGFRALGGKPSEQIRNVFDRLLATDEQLAAARQQAAAGIMEPLLAGMTESERATYRTTAEAADAEALQELQGALMEPLRRELKQWFKSQREDVAARIRAELEQQPVYRAWAYLTRGTVPGETTLPGILLVNGKPAKLHRDAIVEQFGEDYLRSLPRPYLFQRTDGLDPDVAAVAFGFASAREMLDAIIAAPRLEQAVALRVGEEIRGKYGDLLEDHSKLAKVAADAVHGEARVSQILTELSILRRMVRRRGGPSEPVPVDRAALREQARRTIAGRKIQDVRPWPYQRAAATAGTEAFNAARAGNLEAAYAAKARQALYLHLYRAARDAQVAIERQVNYLRKMGEPQARLRLGRAGGTERLLDPVTGETREATTYLDQVDGLLERFAFKPATRVELRRRQSLAEFVFAQQAAGLEVAVPPRLLDEAFRTHYRDLTAEELGQIYDAVRSIDFVARKKNELTVEGKRRRFNDAVVEIVSSLQAHLPVTRPLNPDVRASGGLARDGYDAGLGLHVGLIRIENMIDRADGLRDVRPGKRREEGVVRYAGAWRRLVWSRIEAAETAERDYLRRLTPKITEVYGTLSNERRKQLGNVVGRYTVEGETHTLTWAGLLAIALNTGNEGNRSKLLRGMGWSESELDGYLDKLTRSDWEFVQRVWDTLDLLWPDIAALEQRLHGVAPPRVEPVARSRKLADGSAIDLRGGYFPLVYDSRRSAVGERQLDVTRETQTLFGAGYVRALTVHSHVQKRVDEFARTLSLDLDIIPSHLIRVVHDLTHREALTDLWRLFHEDRVVAAMNRHFGPEIRSAFVQWLKDVANSQAEDWRPDTRKWVGILRQMRLNAGVVSLGLRATTMLQNFGNISNALEFVQPKYLARAMTAFYGDREKMVETIQAKSGEMRHRFDTLERDVQEAVRKLDETPGTRKLGRKTKAAQRFAYFGIAITDAAVAYPTWLGAYYQALDEAQGDPRAEELAIVAADRAVRLGLGSGATKDLAAMQRRQGEAWKWLTQFYTWMSGAYNRGSELVYDTRHGDRGPRDLAWLLARAFFFWAGPAVLGNLLSNRGPDEDDEGWTWWLLETLGSYAAGTVPLLREAYGAFATGRDATVGPVGVVLKEARLAFDAIGDALDDEESLDRAITRGLKASGYVFGLPTGQASITTDYLLDVWAGRERPDNPAEFVSGLLFRRKEKRR